MTDKSNIQVVEIETPWGVINYVSPDRYWAQVDGNMMEFMLSWAQHRGLLAYSTSQDSFARL